MQQEEENGINKMKKKQYVAMILVLTTLLGGLSAGCQSKENSDQGSLTSESLASQSTEVSEKEENSDIQKSVLDQESNFNGKEANEEEKEIIESLLDGIDERYVILNTENLNLTEDMNDPLGIICNVEVLSENIQIDTEGEYEVLYCVTVLEEGLELAKEALSGEESSSISSLDGEAQLILKEKIKVVTKEEAADLKKEGKKVVGA